MLILAREKTTGRKFRMLWGFHRQVFPLSASPGRFPFLPLSLKLFMAGVYASFTLRLQPALKKRTKRKPGPGVGMFSEKEKGAHRWVDKNSRA